MSLTRESQRMHAAVAVAVRRPMYSRGRRSVPVGMQIFVDELVSRWGPLAAGAVLIILPAAAVFFLIQRHPVSGLTAGAATS